MDQEEKASIEHLVAAGHLQKYRQSRQPKAREIRQTFHLVYIVQHFVKSDYEPKSGRVISVSCETHTQILSNTIRRRLTI